MRKLAQHPLLAQQGEHHGIVDREVRRVDRSGFRAAAVLFRFKLDFRSVRFSNLYTDPRRGNTPLYGS